MIPVRSIKPASSSRRTTVPIIFKLLLVSENARPPVYRATRVPDGRYCRRVYNRTIRSVSGGLRGGLYDATIFEFTRTE